MNSSFPFKDSALLTFSGFVHSSCNSISNSCNVSIWSEVNATGTNTIPLTSSFFSNFSTILAVCPPNHGFGPTWDCHTKRYGFLNLIFSKHLRPKHLPHTTPNTHDSGQLHTILLLLRRFSRVRLCDPIDGSPPGSPIPGILQARTLEWVAIAFSNA